MARDDITVRWVRAEDAARLEAFYSALTDDSRAARFHGACRGISHERAAHDSTADHHHRDGFVAEYEGRIVGHLVLEPMRAGAEEVAVAVADDLQHHGVGSLLMAAAVASARLRGVRHLQAWIRPDNEAMRRLFTGTSRPTHLIAWDGYDARYELDVPPFPHAA
ncbi:MAG TPA: GNAT family N-acetyltransferase [Candidatus Limnocylindria bacterium]|jgi:L-amino acid N-acyltransferase YncA|nr:GNAT family N-acetyltransferase [Candidatus Limnocylindria bacterium]